MSSILDQTDDSGGGQGPLLSAPVSQKWSLYQQAVFGAVQMPGQNVLIQAVAGSGKTTTIIEAMKFAPGSSLFMAFNKAIAEDIRRRAHAGDVRTLNALGHQLMTYHRPAAKLNSRKVLEIIKRIMKDDSYFKDYGYTLSRVVGLAKNCAVGIEREPKAQDFADIIDAYSFEVPFDKQSDFAWICLEAFEQSRLDLETFDFDDQLWVPVYERWEFPEYTNCFVDECQDLSPIQHLMLERLAGRGARIVGVGDRHQAIYGFRGASHDSMDLLKAKFQMHELPLSISYRCAQEVVQAAQAFCPEIMWREDAPQGKVLEANIDPGIFTKHMIVCRNNAPLFRAILAQVRERQPCQVMSNFLDSFQNFIKGFKCTYTLELQAKLDRWFEREREECLAKGKKGKLAGLYDKYDTLSLFCREFKLVADVVALVQRLANSTSGPIFATIHKAKGLEHEHIYILRPDLLGGFGDLTEEQQQQEDNLHYVAITRAKETLTYGATRK